MAPMTSSNTVLGGRINSGVDATRYCAFPFKPENDGHSNTLFVMSDYEEVPEECRKRTELEQNVSQQLLENVRSTNGSSRVLTLDPGQGGTFNFTPRIRNESGQLVTSSKGSEYHPWVPTFEVFGSDIRFIGVKGCSTGVGVCFEITGNRLFCAHISAWPSEREQPLKRLEGVEFDEIEDAVAIRLQHHAQMYKWCSDDVMKDTAICTCVEVGPAGSAVIAGINQFLGINVQTVLEDHGFIALPGERDPRGCMKFATLSSEVVSRHYGALEVFHDVSQICTQIASICI